MAPACGDLTEKEAIDSVNGALALRPQIEKIVDQIWEEGFDGIYFIKGIGGTYASSMQVEVYMRRQIAKLPVYVEARSGISDYREQTIYRPVGGNLLFRFPATPRRWWSWWIMSISLAPE